MAKGRDELAERVGLVVGTRRRSKKMSQEALAARIGISAVTLSNIERGENIPSLPVFLELVRELQIDTAELAGVLERRADRQRLQLEIEARELLHALETRDLRLVISLSKAMRES